MDDELLSIDFPTALMKQGSPDKEYKLTVVDSESIYKALIYIKERVRKTKDKTGVSVTEEEIYEALRKSHIGEIKIGMKTKFEYTSWIAKAAIIDIQYYLQKLRYSVYNKREENGDWKIFIDWSDPKTYAKDEKEAKLNTQVNKELNDIIIHTENLTRAVEDRYRNLDYDLTRYSFEVIARSINQFKYKGEVTVSQVTLINSFAIKENIPEGEVCNSFKFYAKKALMRELKEKGYSVRDTTLKSTGDAITIQWPVKG